MAKADESKVEQQEQAEEAEGKAPDQAPGEQKPVKTLPEAEHNSKMAELRRKHDAEIKAVRAEFDEYRKGVEAKEKAANDAAAEKVEALRKDLPESVNKLLDKLSPVEQLEWLSDPANKIVKQEIPPLPAPEHQPGQGPRVTTII